MSPNKTDNIQQQIIFTEVDFPECENNEAQQGETLNKKQIIFGNDTHIDFTGDQSTSKTAIDDEVSAFHLQQDEANIINHKRSWPWTVVICLLIIVCVIEAVDFFLHGFQISPVVTSIYGLLLVILLFLAGNALFREFVGVRQFKQRQVLKQKATRLLITDDPNEARTCQDIKRFCDNISQNLPCDVWLDNNSQVLWNNCEVSHYNSQELLQLYSREVLSKVDEKALHEVGKFSTEAVVLVALSPVAIIDMLIMLSRNLRMINKVAGLYGLKLSYWSRIKLIKQVFVNMAYAGATELITDFGTDMLGAELLGKLSTRFAQGLGAGMLTARLGAKTMELCRPIPFQEKPKLADVRNKIASQIKSLLTSNNESVNK